MFRCNLCDTVSQPSAKPVKVVVETRRVQYYRSGSEGREAELIGNGVETVREIMVGPCCMEGKLQ